ncbi:MAG TPA: ribbon-helix-helix protein, CopG family [Micropepsaceae bacterium]|nr:ribbon-helix-helix protein, CopG family [Micropepsaceae bacterium]
MTKSVTITARITPELANKLVAYAKATKRTRSWVLQDMLKRYVDRELAFAEAFNVGIRELTKPKRTPDRAVRQARAHIEKRKRQKRRTA